MRMIVNCAGGASHSMMLLKHTTVQDVKEYITEKEGTPISNQALLFAGRQLGPDTALLLDELQLDSYSLAHEVVVYMQPQLSQSIRVYLSAQPGGAKLRLFPEIVEASSTLANIQQLLTQRQLTCTEFPPICSQGVISTSAHSSGRDSRAEGAHAAARAQQEVTGSSGRGAAAGSTNVVVKREDGSCCSRVHADEGCTMERLLEAIWEVEGKSPTTLSFYQAQDGCLHAVYGASNDVQQ